MRDRPLREDAGRREAAWIDWAALAQSGAGRSAGRARESPDGPADEQEPMRKEGEDEKREQRQRGKYCGVGVGQLGRYRGERSGWVIGYHRS